MQKGDIAEELFVEFCKLQSWNAQKIPETDNKTPDYEVKTESGSFIAEVSLVTEPKMESGKVYSIKIGDAVRKKITGKKDQLQKYNIPTMLVLCGSSVQLGYESIVAGMYGDMTIPINIKSGKSGEMYFGRNAKMKDSRNTSISAIGFLTRCADRYIHKQEEKYLPFLNIYHNMYAKNSFQEGFFSNSKSIQEYQFTDKNNDDKFK